MRPYNELTVLWFKMFIVLDTGRTKYLLIFIYQNFPTCQYWLLIRHFCSQRYIPFDVQGARLLPHIGINLMTFLQSFWQAPPPVYLETRNYSWGRECEYCLHFSKTYAIIFPIWHMLYVYIYMYIYLCMYICIVYIYMFVYIYIQAANFIALFLSVPVHQEWYNTAWDLKHPISTFLSALYQVNFGFNVCLS